MSGEYEYETEQDVIDTVTGMFKGNAYTYIGTAFHRIVEGNTGGVEKAEAGERKFLYYGKEASEPVPCGRTFDIDGNRVSLDIAQCKTALSYRNEHPDAFHDGLLYHYGDQPAGPARGDETGPMRGSVRPVHLAAAAV